MDIGGDPCCAPQAAVAVETIATAALRMRLRTHELVRVSVQCNSWDLLGGRIQGARVEGRGWESPQGLTARVLEVSAGAIQCSPWPLGGALVVSCPCCAASQCTPSITGIVAVPAGVLLPSHSVSCTFACSSPPLPARACAWA